MKAPSPVRGRRGPLAWLLRTEVVGAAVIIAGLAVMAVSYTAENGLPFQSTYALSVDVPNAAELTKNADVRIGGTRVGQVLSISAERGGGGTPPFARLRLSLKPSIVRHVPVDSRTTIRVASLLGGKYVQLTLGSSPTDVPDGGRLPLANADTIVDLDEAFRVFDRRTSNGLRTVIARVGDALAGRGVALNDAIGATRELLLPLDRVLKTLSDPATGLARLLPAAATVTSALAPLADRLSAGLANAATTFAAIDRAGGSLERALDTLPPAESETTATLVRLNPVLADAVGVGRGLAPGVRILPRALAQVGPIITLALPVLKKVPRLSGPLGAVFGSVDRFVADPASVGALAALKGHDFATFSLSLFLGLGGLFQDAAQAQLHCNTLGLWAHNFASALSDGDSSATWLTFLPILNQNQGQQTSDPSSDLHFNPYPREDAGACESGNEVYSAGQSIGHPAATLGNNVPATRSSVHWGAGR